MKAYYRKKGRYKDGRSKIIIEKEEGTKLLTKALPTPEVLWKIIDRYRLGDILKEKKGQVKVLTKVPLND